MGNDFTPRMYQLNARDQVIHSYEHEGKTVFLILLPTGMGKTFISTLTIEMLLDRGVVKQDESILFLVQDRKLKHQLYEMATNYGLAEYGYLYLLDDQKGIPAHMTRQHSALAKFIFATPVMLANAITGRFPRISIETLSKVKVVIIDEILDILAQSYGIARPQEDTISYIEKRFGRGRTFTELVADLKREIETSAAGGYEVNEAQIEERLVREFSARNYRLDKRFEPILHILGLLKPDSEKIVLGLTASLSQDAKIDLLKQHIGGGEKVAEIRPVGDDFEDYQPAYQLQRIRVFDDWVSGVDASISNIKRSLMSALNKIYKMLTGRNRIPGDRILLFVSDLMSKKDVQEKLLARVGGDKGRLEFLLSSARAYLLMTVARQRLLESTFQTFQKFIMGITNSVLLGNSDFESIRNEIASREELKLPDEKEKRLLYWLNRLTKEGQSVLVLCRFVEMTKHLMNMAEQNGIPSTNVHGKMTGSIQHERIKSFKTGAAKILFASERLIEKGTDLPEADVGIYYGTTVSLERYEQSLGRIRSSVHNIKTFYTISYNQTVEDEKALKRDTMFLELIGGKLGTLTSEDEDTKSQ
ncbi:MAG: helicase-related protein [Candidatus Thorarchaeota archaeon]|nr:helicase-related protein [Candidatus Thorarchaeota archaeon]